jgi:PIN domain nuclease of toxin-antitoxin system
MLSGITDTHALVWYASGASNKLGVAARRIFEAADRKDGSGMVIIPTVVLHEISSLLIAEKIKLGTNLADWTRSLEKHGFLQIVDVSVEMVLRSDNFKNIADPFDRLIMGCADLFEQPLITLDSIITDSHLVQVVWD